MSGDKIDAVNVFFNQSHKTFMAVVDILELSLSLSNFMLFLCSLVSVEESPSFSSESMTGCIPAEISFC